MLKTEADAQLAMLEYRNTITAGMTTSTIQRLLSRSTRSILPQQESDSEENTVTRADTNITKTTKNAIPLQQA